ncbi:hypothetical protein [Bremerella cremea]|uniref:hypothetical protein n=1 Tax=Bremerella cremea TaxID=1031537 RepID=UPI0031E65F9D
MVAPLVFFRVFFGVMMLYHLYGMTVDHRIHFFYVLPDFHFTYPGFAGWSLGQAKECTSMWR